MGIVARELSFRHNCGAKKNGGPKPAAKTPEKLVRRLIARRCGLHIAPRVDRRVVHAHFVVDVRPC